MGPVVGLPAAANQGASHSVATLYLSHPACLEHRVPADHPERPARLEAVEKILAHDHFAALQREEAPRAEREHLLLAHTEEHVAAIEDAVPGPQERMRPIDPDTWLSPGSWEAALRAAGAGIEAVDAVANRRVANAFCAVRPPGHHATADQAMGFCLFNNIAIAARHALEAYGAERVAIVDFDVHHGNGTEAIFRDDARVLYCSSHQWPAYPGSGAVAETGAHGNVVNCPLPAGTDAARFREAWMTRLLPAVDAWRPDFLFISAGFDGHAKDPLASWNLTEEDYVWATLRLMELAARHAEGRIVSMLEGGYDLGALAASVAVHVKVLMEGADG